MSEARLAKDELVVLTAQNHLPRAQFKTEESPDGFTSAAKLRMNKSTERVGKYLTGPSAIGRSKRAAEQAAAAAFVNAFGGKPKEWWSQLKAKARKSEPEQSRQQPRQHVRFDRGDRFGGRDAANWGT